MDANVRLSAIVEKLKIAKARDAWPFGAEMHCFRLEPALAESQVVEFEKRWRIKLPEEYRAFITVVANGGAGPAYGLFTLEEAVSYRGTSLPDNFFLSPFPFLTAYNPYKDPKLFEYWQRSGKMQVTKDEHKARKFSEITGTLALCHEGCGYLHFLVVSGGARGQMWLDATVSDGGYLPLAAGFLEWCERWLDSALAGGNGAWWLNKPSE